MLCGRGVGEEGEEEDDTRGFFSTRRATAAKSPKTAAIRGEGATAGTVETAGALAATTAAHVVGVGAEFVVVAISREQNLRESNDTKKPRIFAVAQDKTEEGEKKTYKKTQTMKGKGKKEHRTSMLH